MSIKPVSVKINNPSSSEVKKQSNGTQISSDNARNINFNGAGDMVIMFMDGIERGGFVASFLAQDCVGMVAPRILEGLNRNREETGHLNWDFAKREGLRECLSGPSMFMIPAGMLYFIKKYSGTANNVPVDFIKAFGHEFGDYAKKSGVNLSDKVKTQKEYYEQVYRNVLKASTNGEMPEEEINKVAKSFAEQLDKVRDAKSKGFIKNLTGKQVQGSKEDLLAKMNNEFIAIRKKYMPPSTPQWVAEIKPEGKDAKNISASFTSLSNKLLDYSKDVIKNTKKFVDGQKSGDVLEFIKNHTSRRMGSRAITNFGMWLAVVGFYFMIPKIYSMGLEGKNPGMAGLEDGFETQTNQEKIANNKKGSEEKSADKVELNNNAEKVNFSGKKEAFTKLAESLVNNKNVKKASDFFEFDGASMTQNSTLMLLFGFCLPTRLANATDHHDNKEIMTRDLLSFGSILFAAKAISRGFSKLFTGISGLALNTTPADHDKSFMHKLKNYFAPNGIGVLSSDEIKAKYSNVHEYKDGINGFFDYVQENGGNLKRMLAIDPEIKKHTEKLLNKSLDEAKISEIETAFQKAKGSKDLDAIYDILKNADNKLVKRAKLLNSSFGFASTIVLVPAFMIWLAKHCERMTKNDVTKERFQEIAKRYQHDDFASADINVMKAIDEKVLNDIKANKIYGYKYDKKNNIIKDMKGKEKQVSDVRVEIKKYVDMAVPKGQRRLVIKPEIKEEKGLDYQLFLTSQNQLKQNFLTK